MEDIEQVLECRRHDRVVIESVEDVVQDAEAVGEALVRLVAHDGGVAHRREETLERLGVLDACGVVQGEDTEDVAWLQADTRLLDEQNGAVF